MTCKRFFFTINLQISDASFGEMTQRHCCLTPRSNFLYHDVQLGVYLWLPTLLQCPDLRSAPSLSPVCSDSTIRLPLKPQLRDERKAPALLALWNGVLSPLSAVQQHVSSLKTTAGFPNITNAAAWRTAPIKMQSGGGLVPVARPPSNSITCPLIILSPQNKSRVDFLMLQYYM